MIPFRPMQRLFVLSLALLASVPLFAQNPSWEIGGWLLMPKLKDTTLVDPDGDVSIQFDEQGGGGLSLNHFWTDSFSTELSNQLYPADMKIGIEGVPGTFDVGNLEITSTALIGQFHFQRSNRLSPYLGAGIAHLSGKFDPADDVTPEENFDLESKTTWTASAGADVTLPHHIALAAEVRYTPWSAQAKDDPSSDAIDLDPLTVGVAVKYRF